MAIIKRPNGKYQARLEGVDGRILSMTFSKKSDAEQQELSWKIQKHTGILATNSERNATLNQFFEEWYKDILEETPEEKRSGWRERQKQMYEIYIRSLIGSMKLKDIKPQNIRRVLIEMSKQNKADQTRLQVFGMLRQMFGDAIENYQCLTFNPAIKKLRPELSSREAVHLNLEQTRRLLEYVKDKKYGLAIWTQLYMGLRIGELQALRWEDVDLEVGRIHVRRTFVRKTNRFRNYPKGRKQHSHGIPSELWKLLNEAKKSAASELILTSRLGTMLPYNWYLDVLRKHCKKLDLPLIGTHGLRHSTSEVYLSHGARREDLQALFAHSSMSVTERYLHGRDTNLEKVSNVIQLFQVGIDPKSTQIANSSNTLKNGG